MRSGRKKETPIQRLTAMVTNWKLMLVFLVLLLIGVAFLWLSGCPIFNDKPRIATLIRDIGALLVISVGLGAIWELQTKRAFRDELLATVELANNIRRAGITNVAERFNTDIDWDDLFDGVSNLDMFFSYAQTWRGMHRKSLMDTAQRENARVRVLLPDPASTTVMSELAKKYGKSARDVQEHIERAATDLREIFQKEGAQAEFELRFLHEVPLFSAYRFDDTTVIALAKHRRAREDVPSFVAVRGGFLNEFVYKELDALLTDEYSKDVTEVGNEG